MRTEITDRILGRARRVLTSPLHRLLNLIDPPVIVLVYHRVETLSSDPEMLSVTPENFRAQMHYLKENVSLVRFEEDWTKTRRPAAAVTFDDGYADNAREALPILEEAGVPAAFFISTGLIGTTQEFWWHELERIILTSKFLPASFTLNNERLDNKWPTSTDSERREFYYAIVRLMNDADPVRRQDWLAQLRLWAQFNNKPDDTTHRAMTVDELRRLAESKWVTIGAHTVTHSRLSSLSAVAQREEIATSKKQLREWLGKEIKVFSYPFGKRRDFTKKTAALCREAGFTKAAANFPGQAHQWTDPYRIPRLLVRNWPAEIFAEKLREFWTR
jgi:peptidoglycan/xylan/chitin deacetylase (PgdA/CDA1 family)